jgi:hypothetical protein
MKAFSQNDIVEINKKNLTIEEVNAQIECFKKGFPFLNVIRPATISDGIIHYPEKQVEELLEYYNQYKGNYTIIKFVPASGAATRMFHSLYVFQDENRDVKEPKLEKYPAINEFIEKIRSFAFYSDLVQVSRLNKYPLPEDLISQKRYSFIIELLLTETGLDYANLPKGLLKFHKYGLMSRTAFEEHFIEGAKYTTNKDNTVRIHMTVSPEHESRFKLKLKEIERIYMEYFDVDYNVSFSIQKLNTDTIAVDGDNNPIRDNEGSLIFRPGGHGALLENLNELDADIVFIKNIDNVTPDHLKDDTIFYKKALGGKLIEVREAIVKFLHSFEKKKLVDDASINQIKIFLKENLNIILPPDFDNWPKDNRTEYLKNKLNRPIRICGMVKNTGEPGGGPFWVQEKDGSCSLQILETSQIDMNNPHHKKCLEGSTHFNPVDLVCFIKDYKNVKFDLHKYRDPETGFIAVKSKGGKQLKALELPGLWNGSMSDWNTIFVEVPLTTFSPVKVVNDLLRPAHQ